MSTKTLMTIEQFAQLDTADTEDYDLVEGELIPLSSGTPKHARIRRLLERALEDYFQQKVPGEVFAEVDCRLGEDTVRRPDLSIFLNDRLSQIDLNRIPIPFAPDIAIEVLSPSEGAIDVNRKVREYLLAGCQEVWLVDHANAEVFVHSSEGIQLFAGNKELHSRLLPDFAAPLKDLWADPSK